MRTECAKSSHVWSRSETLKAPRTAPIQGDVSRLRTLSALLVDVPAGRAAQLSTVLEDAGWTVRAVPVQGGEALSSALGRRSWDAVLYGGDGPLAVPSRKALALVRLADPHLPLIAV